MLQSLITHDRRDGFTKPTLAPEVRTSACMKADSGSATNRNRAVPDDDPTMRHPWRSTRSERACMVHSMLHRWLPLFVTSLLLILTGCGADTGSGMSHSAAAQTSSGAANDQTITNAGANASDLGKPGLRMTIDGQPWEARFDVFGAVHPAGYDRAVLIAGSAGEAGGSASQQSFNLNLFGVDGPGRYAIATGNASNSVAQFGDLSPERYLAGSMLGFTMEVDILRMDRASGLLEVRFSGTMKANDDSTLTITDGYFLYQD